MDYSQAEDFYYEHIASTIYYATADRGSIAFSNPFEVSLQPHMREEENLFSPKTMPLKRHAEEPPSDGDRQPSDVHSQRNKAARQDTERDSADSNSKPQPRLRRSTRISARNASIAARQARKGEDVLGEGDDLEPTESTQRGNSKKKSVSFAENKSGHGKLQKPGSGTSPADNNQERTASSEQSGGGSGSAQALVSQSIEIQRQTLLALANLDQRLTTVITKLFGSHQALAQRHRELEQRLLTHGSAIERLEQRLQRHDTSIERLERRLEIQNSALEHISTIVERVPGPERQWEFIDETAGSAHGRQSAESREPRTSVVNGRGTYLADPRLARPEASRDSRVSSISE